MPKNVFYRDFTICKAVALVALMGLAAALGGVPHADSGVAEAATPEARVIPAMVYKFWDECDTEEVGVAL
ncbi:hypothetical protein [Antarctobacter jejuensis]|uniref:hypothetical protein n=1 Tax=Antarctobacter jejuensis TaxID=1439938 RepID=UPI003FD5A637